VLLIIVASLFSGPPVAALRLGDPTAAKSE